MGFASAVRTCFVKYVTFSGRASRSEFWWYQLFYVLVLLAIVLAYAVASQAGEVVGVASVVIVAALILPGLAVTVRRLHDRNRSGAHYLWVLMPVVGGLVVLIWCCQRGVEGDNRFGPDPLATDGSSRQ